MRLCRSILPRTPVEIPRYIPYGVLGRILGINRCDERRQLLCNRQILNRRGPTWNKLIISQASSLQHLRPLFRDQWKLKGVASYVRKSPSRFRLGYSAGQCTGSAHYPATSKKVARSATHGEHSDLHLTCLVNVSHFADHWNGGNTIRIVDRAEATTFSGGRANNHKPWHPHDLHPAKQLI